MPLELQGDFGQMVYRDNDSSRYLEIPTETGLTLFDKLAIRKPNLTLNTLGLYTQARVGADGKARFANLTVPRHLLQKRKNGCGWHPKGNMVMETDTIDTCPIEYNGEQCPDFLWEGCLEMFAGVGNEVDDLFSSPEKRQLMQSVFNRVYLGLGNSFYDLATYGQHPLISQSDSNGWYTEGEDQWADFVDQQSACGGHITMLDAMKAEGRTNLQVVINESDVSGGKFVGSAMDLFENLVAQNGPELRIMASQMIASGSRPLILAHPKIFDRYKQELISEHGTIPEAYLLRVMGTDGIAQSDPNVLMFDGYWVVCMNEWALFDTMLGVETYRAILTVPGNLALAYDVPTLNQFTGMGMRIVQKLDPPDNGKVYMYTNFRIGAGIIDPKLINMAALTLTPA